LAVSRVRDPELGPRLGYEKYWPEDQLRIPRDHRGTTADASDEFGAGPILGGAVAGVVVVVAAGAAFVLRSRRRRRPPDPWS
jgi:hypothetical protein